LTSSQVTRSTQFSTILFGVFFPFLPHFVPFFMDMDFSFLPYFVSLRNFFFFCLKVHSCNVLFLRFSDDSIRSHIAKSLLSCLSINSKSVSVFYFIYLIKSSKSCCSCIFYLIHIISKKMLNFQSTNFPITKICNIR
jgi:hypothetical protein